MIETLSNVRNRKSEKETNIINSSETLRTLGVKLSRISNDLTTEIYGSTKNKQLQRRATTSNMKIQHACKMVVSYGVRQSYQELPIKESERDVSQRIETEISLMKNILVKERELKEAQCRYSLFMAEKRRLLREGYW
ncbi:uncharacterized protein LOC134848449 isoform X2 [Symsagittifera roscoffensis]